MLNGAVATGARGKPRPLAPEHITANFASRTPDNRQLQEFLETNLNRKFIEWPVSSEYIFRLTLAALYYHPHLDAARANPMSPNTK